MDNNYFGMFKKIKDSCRENNVLDLQFYNEYFSSYYDALTKEMGDEDIRFYINYCMKYQSPILELGCGGGRVSIALAKKKLYVTGVEKSEDMLKIFERRLDTQYKRIKKYIKLYHQDAQALNLPEKYNVVIFPATTIRLIKGELSTFFNGIYEVLAANGCFIFDFLDEESVDKDGIGLGPLEQYSFTDEEGHLNVVVYQPKVDSVNQLITYNFFASVFKENIEHYLSYTKLRRLTKREICEQAEQSKFTSYEIEYVQGKYNFCILKK